MEESEGVAMEMILERIAKKENYTIGRLYAIERVGDEYLSGTRKTYLCDTLEPAWRDLWHGARKMKGRTAIPEGRYPVVINYSQTLREWLPILVGVPKFKGIRIHAGNTVKDTQGCILVGKNKEVGKVLDSRFWLQQVKNRIVEAKGWGEGVWLNVR